MLLAEAHARVPAQQGVVVVRRAHRLGALVGLHRLAQPVACRADAAGAVTAEQRARAALRDEAGVVLGLVIAWKPGRQLLGATHALAALARKPVGNRENQRNQRLRVAGIRRKHVFADALGLCRLVQEPVAFRLGERRGDGRRRQRLQTEHAHLPGTSTDPAAMPTA